MILNFLQTRNPPILPALHQMPHTEYRAQDGTESGFNDDIEKLRNFGATNTETLGELLFHFFRLYSFELEYDSSVISVRHGKRLTRKEKGWDHTSKEGQWRLAIEEPFNTSRNLGNSADSTAFRGLHLELRQAFEHLATGVKLDKLIEAYEFPPEEKVIFKKPVAGPKPTLTPAIVPTHPSSRPRGGGSIRGSRHNNASRQSANFRRSSSGASFGRHPYPYLGSPGAHGGLDYINLSSPTPEAVARLQEQLLHQSQVNGLQLEQLKARFALQAQQIRAAEQARNASLVHAHTVAQGSSKGSQGNSSTVSPQKTPYVTGNSSPSLSHTSLYPDYLYHPLGYDGQPLTQSISHDGARTNPSSPSLASAVPRRTQQRLSELSGNAAGSGSLRSQSQPARGIQQSFMIPGYSQFGGIPGYGIPSYSISNASQDPSTMSQSSGDGSVNLENSLYRTGSLQSDHTPKEYVGYFVPGTQPPTTAIPQPQPPTQLPVFGTLQQIPAYSDLAHRRNRQSQDLQLTLNGNRHASRSPSPLGHHQRTFSIPAHQNTASLRSAPLPRMVERQRPEHIELPQSALTRPGPPVVNGSTALPRTPENQFTTSDEDASTAAGEGSGASFFSNSDTFSQADALGLSGYQHQQTFSPVVSSTQTRDSLPEKNHQQIKSTRSPPQAFPPYMDQPILSSQLASNHEEQLSPRTLQAPWIASSSSKPTIPQIDTVQAAQLSGKPSEVKTAPVVLSPVYETRTPSPTTMRRVDHLRQGSLNGVLAPANGDITTNAPNLNGRPVEPVPPTPFDKNVGHEDKHKAITPQASSGQWQTQPTMRKKNRKRTKSGPNPSRNVAPGSSAPSSSHTTFQTARATAPMIETERKGG